MRLGSVLAGGWHDVVVRDDRYLALATSIVLDTVGGIAAGGRDGLDRVAQWVEAQPLAAWRALDAVEAIGAPIRPGAIYAIGENYRSPGEAPGERPARPLVYGKAPGSIAGHGAVLAWDRAVTQRVDAECELGVVIGTGGWRIDPADAMGHVFGYTVLDDVSSRDEWLDGDQWLLGKSMNGFCPIGPWIVTADELDPGDRRLGTTINGIAIQDGRTADMRFSIPELVAFLSRHLTLSSGDVIATGTPARLPGPIGPGRHLEAGDVVTAWIDGIGELTTTIA
jgi:2-keto-4-pentenoate hydratase/2-oxohepta-3-ene-1,7-dioic acid hydratase in catechol pathway